MADSYFRPARGNDAVGLSFATLPSCPAHWQRRTPPAADDNHREAKLSPQTVVNDVEASGLRRLGFTDDGLTVPMAALDNRTVSPYG